MEIPDYMWGIFTGLGIGAMASLSYQALKLTIKYKFNGAQRVPKGKDLVAVIDLCGPVMPSAESSPLGGGRSSSVANLESLVSQVHKAADKEAKGIIFRINTPGGSPSLSGKMYNYIRNIDANIEAYLCDKLSPDAAHRLRQERKDKPKIRTITYIDDMCCSAGYHIASATDRIVIAPHAKTGSIGVLSMTFTALEAAKMFGFEIHTSKRGKYKGHGFPTIEVTEEMKAYHEEIMEDIYNMFVGDVVRGRNKALELANSSVKLVVDEFKEKYAHGGVIFAKKSREGKLVDEIGYFADALRLFEQKELGGLKNPVGRVFGSGSLFSQPSIVGALMFAFADRLGIAIGREMNPARLLDYRQDQILM